MSVCLVCLFLLPRTHHLLWYCYNVIVYTWIWGYVDNYKTQFAFRGGYQILAHFGGWFPICWLHVKLEASLELRKRRRITTVESWQFLIILKKQFRLPIFFSTGSKWLLIHCLYMCKNAFLYFLYFQSLRYCLAKNITNILGIWFIDFASPYSRNAIIIKSTRKQYHKTPILMQLITFR